MNILQSHERNDRIKWIAVTLAIVLLIGAVGAVIGLGAKHNGWFSEESTADVGGMEIDNDATGSGIKLMSVQIPRAKFADYGIATIADSAYELTATLTPADAENKKVTYTAAWSNPSSSWATGKQVSDYVTIAQASDGALTATLTCKQAFGEKIVVTCTSQANAAAKATADLHYKQRTTGYALKITSTGNTINLSSTGTKTGAYKANFNATANATFAVTVNKSDVYTKTNDDTVTKVVLTPSGPFKAAITDGGLSATSVTEKTVNLSSLSGTLAGFLDSAFGTAIYAQSAANRNTLIDRLKLFSSGTAYTVALYNGSSKVSEFTLTIDSSVISGQKVVEGLNLDKTEIVF